MKAATETESIVWTPNVVEEGIPETVMSHPTVGEPRALADAIPAGETVSSTAGVPKADADSSSDVRQELVCRKVDRVLSGIDEHNFERVDQHIDSLLEEGLSRFFVEVVCHKSEFPPAARK